MLTNRRGGDEGVDLKLKAKTTINQEGLEFGKCFIPDLYKLYYYYFCGHSVEEALVLGQSAVGPVHGLWPGYN